MDGESTALAQDTAASSLGFGIISKALEKGSSMLLNQKLETNTNLIELVADLTRPSLFTCGGQPFPLLRGIGETQMLQKACRTQGMSRDPQVAASGVSILPPN